MERSTRVMSLPLNKISSAFDEVENVQSTDISPSKSLHSKLYSILKSGYISTSKNGVNHDDNVECHPPKRMREASNSNIEQNNFPWKCWQCGYLASGECDLASHVRVCEQRPDETSSLPGCPFCPKDEYHSSDWSFSVSAFNIHVRKVHADISSLTCGYCLLTMETFHLEDLVHHVLVEHKLPWRPSPASLAYLRRDQLPHRVVTCMGCGWCTFVLRANNSVQPPTSLQSHLAECPFNGGRVNVAQLSSKMCSSKLILKELVAECDQLSQSFTQTFPLVRGYSSDSPQNTPKQLTLHYRHNPENISTTANSTDMKIPNPHPKKKTTARKSSSKTPFTKTSRTFKPTINSFANRMEFDVPITLPPPHPVSVQRKQTPACLYVCPLCGDNALASLRQRDEHLQSAHHGELVFPCQICGLAYPLYIALRRHAALKHNSAYDLVRYGPPELLELEPAECPVCRLVAFTDRSVLKLHLTVVHGASPDRVKCLLRADTRKSGSADEGVGRRGRRSSKRDTERPPKSCTPKVKSEKRRLKAPSLSRLELLLGTVSGDPAPVSCRLCHTTVDNAKEFKLHLELDHAETEECEQLGCQACGRIFFGSGGRIDLIGHLRVLHQDADQSSALSCSHAERKPVEKISEDGTPIRIRPCEALFSSPRLRQVHAATSDLEHPAFACPLALELPDCENPDALDLPEQLRAAIMETESAADREGLMILAYCCPNCSRLFAGFQAPIRFASHRLACQIEPRAVVEQVQPPPVAPPVAPPVTTTEVRSSSTKLLESVLRQEPLIPIRR